MIASDVNPASGLLGKVAAAFSAKLHEPVKSLPMKLKADMNRGFCFESKDNHKKDALAAAVSAYGSVIPFLERIEKRLRKNGFSPLMLDEIARKVMCGDSGNIHSAMISASLNQGNA